ncbi:hypothetical protein HZA71_00990, partial [Candidatus Falkowbacteria bacterium]|nr:hypothetical protein [Candidatus Falkowbacteria bacterium]
KDILWIVLAFVILWIGVFMGWGAYYVAMILRDAYKVTNSIRKKFELIDQILKTIKEKTEKTANYVPPLIEGVSKIVEHFMEKKKVKEKKKKAKD